MRQRKTAKKVMPCRYEVSVDGLGYSEEEEMFLRELAKYRDLNQVRFPSNVEVLRLLRSLGYRKVAESVSDQVQHV